MKYFRLLLNYSYNCFWSADDLVQLASSYEASGGLRLSGSSIIRRIRSTQQNRPKFVSAFCQSNCGDVSPNVLGTFCIDTGLPCDFNHSTCNGKNELCYGRGPGYSPYLQVIIIIAFIFLYIWKNLFIIDESLLCCRYPDEFESTRIIGNRQFQKAVDLFNSASEEIQGKVDFRHTYLDFSQLEVNIPTSTGGQQVVKTCPAAMGFAFAAGTTDGPGAFDFKQGDPKVDHTNQMSLTSFTNMVLTGLYHVLSGKRFLEVSKKLT